MILVFIFLLIFLITFLILFTYIKVDAKKVYISNITNFKYDIEICIDFCLFNKIRFFRFTITKDKIKREKIFKKLEKKISNEKINISLCESKKILKKVKINLETFNAKIKIGTEEIILTSFIVGILSSFIGILLGKAIKHYKPDKYEYVIIPYYNKKNIFDMNLNCIINVKLVHIIYVIYMFSKKRSENKNERTSNRRSYDYSYE